MTKDQIRSAALQLDAHERESLAEDLLLSITEDERDAIDAAWLAEAHRRDARFRAGESTARPVEEVIERLRARAEK